MHYTIQHDGITTDFCCHDQGLAPNWYAIGTYYFAADGSEYVRIEATAAGVSTYMADAVKFVDPNASASPTVSIKNAHYYTWHDADGDGELNDGENVYLINFVDSGSDGVLDTRGILPG